MARSLLLARISGVAGGAARRLSTALNAAPSKGLRSLLSLPYGSVDRFDSSSSNDARRQAWRDEILFELGLDAAAPRRESRGAAEHGGTAVAAQELERLNLRRACLDATS
mmetsp:Transcript_33606/g.104086  ORF Transcript_33606/g.104086 Transcript_33606/m.104086 type:complete len:110 (+) Transcript_33606:139-468(+)